MSDDSQDDATTSFDHEAPERSRRAIAEAKRVKAWKKANPAKSKAQIYRWRKRHPYLLNQHRSKSTQRHQYKLAQAKLPSSA